MLKFKTLVFIFIISLSSFSSAQELKYELGQPSAFGLSNIYPNLNFFGNTQLTITANDEEGGNSTNLKKLEINFENANKLTAKDFRLVGEKYRAIVNNVWVFRQVMLEVDKADFNYGQLGLKVYVVENPSNLNNLAEASGPELFSMFGPLVDITPNPLADITRVQYKDKRLTLKLLKNPVFKGPDIGFEIQSMWLGHGEGTLFVNIYNNPSDTKSFKAISLSVEENGMVGETVPYLTINYVDSEGQNYSDSAPLSQFMQEAYDSM